MFESLPHRALPFLHVWIFGLNVRNDCGCGSEQPRGWGASHCANMQRRGPAPAAFASLRARESLEYIFTMVRVFGFAFLPWFECLGLGV